MDGNMRHMEKLEAVAASDVAVLRRKEATYQGSWKAAGGRSAWFMARRNLDRLLVMMRPPGMVDGFSLADLDDLIETHGRPGSPEFDGDRTLDVSLLRYLRECYVAEDIFLKIEDDPSGRDGSVLAVVRDLRRYLLLVEAEMCARGEVKAEGMELVSLSGTELRHVHVETFTGGGGAGGPGVQGAVSDNSGLIIVTGQGGAGEPRPFPAAEVATPLERGVITPDQAKLAVVAVIDRHTANTILAGGGGDLSWARQALYTDCGQLSYKLEPSLEAAHQYRLELLSQNMSTPTDARELLGRVLSLYRRVAGAYVINLDLLPPESRSYWPRFQQELNATEHRAQPTWVRSLYEYHEGPVKWIIRPEHRAWAAEP